MSRSRTHHVAVAPSPILWVNIAMIASACLLMAYYIVTANKLTAANYRIQYTEAEIAALTEDHAVLVEQKIAVEDPLRLTRFAESQGMVKAIHPTHIVGRQGVALVR